MTLLAMAMSAISASILSIPASRLFWRRRMKKSMIMLVICLFTAQYSGGIILTIFLSLIIYLYLRWLIFISGKTSPNKKRYLNITIWLACLYLLAQLIYLPIRLYLNQASLKIAINLTAIALGLTFVVACVEEYANSFLQNNRDRTNLCSR